MRHITAKQALALLVKRKWTLKRFASGKWIIADESGYPGMRGGPAGTPRQAVQRAEEFLREHGET